MEINQIYHGDCVKLLNKLKDESVDCIITDPPYGINYISNYYKDKNPHKKILNDNTLFIPLNELWRVLKPNGAMFVFYSHKIPLIDNRVKNTIIWVKNNWTAGDLKSDFANQYECIAFMPKSKFKLKNKRFSNIWKFDRVPSHQLKHPTQKPIDLLIRMVEAATSFNDLVLDPFAGSGGTLLAAKVKNRRYLGFELEKDYINICKDRLAQNSLFGILE